MRRLRALGLAVAMAGMLVLASTSTASAHHKPCHPKSRCEVPEVPWTLILPTASAGMVGGYYVLNRIRSGRNRDDE